MNGSVTLKTETILPTERSSTSAVYYPPTQKIFIFGGESYGTEYSDIIEYDPLTGSVVIRAETLPSGRARTSAVFSSLTNKVYIFGGYGGGSEIVEYDPSSATVRVVGQLPSAHGTSAAYNPLNNMSYIFGGSTGKMAADISDIVEVGTPYPTNVSVDTGGDGVIEFSLSGELNDTSSPQKVDLDDVVLDIHVSVCTPDGDGNCSIPLKFTSSSAGIVKISNISVEYSTPRNTSSLASVSNLMNITYEKSYINWTWDNPDSSFAYAIIYIDGSFTTYTSNPYYNLTGLAAGSIRTISIRTIDKGGDVNLTWVNNTTNSVPGSIIVNQSYPPCLVGLSHHSTIQDAVNASFDGDEIIVCEGTYQENVKIDKMVDLRSYSGPANTIINASDSNDYTFNITADYVNITGLTIRNVFGGVVRLHYYNFSNISSNYIEWERGISLWQSYYNNISNNTFSCIDPSCNIGLSFKDSGNNTVDSNIIADSQTAINIQDESSSNIIKNNSISDGTWGVYVGMPNPPGCPRYNTITSNNISYSNGIYIVTSPKCNIASTISNNTIFSPTNQGISLANISGIAITNNTIYSPPPYTFRSRINSTNVTVIDLYIGSIRVSFLSKDIRIQPVANPPPDSGSLRNISKHLNLTNESADSWIYLNMSYTLSDLGNVNESTLRMYGYNATSGAWEQLSGINGVDTVNKYVYANITATTHLVAYKTYAPMGIDNNPPEWQNQGLNTSEIAQGEPVSLYAQGKDIGGLYYAVLQTNETGTWVNWSGKYDSPQYMGNVTTWTWSNFTWQNASIPAGTTVGWRIWYNDTAGNWNATDTMTFTIKYPPPNITSWNNSKTNDAQPSITINESEFITFSVTADQPITSYSWFKDGVNQSWNYDNNTTSWAANGTYEINVSISNLNGSSANKSWTITVNDITAPVSITNIANVTGTTWINWTWTNPVDADFNHTIVYINDVWEANVSTPYHNDTGLSPETTYNISTHTVDIYGNINFTWVNASATTQPYPPPNITSYEPASDPSNTEGASRAFSITADQIVNVSWMINGAQVQTNTSVLNASYTNNSAAVGEWNISAIITNPNGSDTQTWLWTVSTYTPPVYRGGGGGYAPTPTPTPIVVVEVEITKQIQSIEGGKSEVVTFEEPELDVSEITINVKNNVSGVEITIQKLSGAPPEIKTTPPPRITGAAVKSYSYLNISTTNITDDDISNASINFTVNKSWILDEEVDENTVTLHRYNNTTANWTALNTTKTGEDNDSIHYEAATPGFSIFVITGDKKPAVAPTATPVPTLTPVLAPTPTPAVAVTPTTPPITPEPTVPEPRPWAPDYMKIGAPIAATSLIIFYFFYVKRRLTARELDEKADRIAEKPGEGRKAGEMKEMGIKKREK